MFKKFIIVFSGLFLMLSVSIHTAFADYSSASTRIEDELEAIESQRQTAPLFEDYRILPTLVEKLETPKMIMNTFFGETSIKDQLTKFLAQDPVNQISTVYEVGKALFNDVQLLNFVHKIMFFPNEEAANASKVQKTLKSQSLKERIQDNLEKIDAKSIYQYQMIE